MFLLEGLTPNSPNLGIVSNAPHFFKEPTHLLLVSIVVSIPACHAGDRGSIPRRGGEHFIVLLLHRETDWEGHEQHLENICL